MLVFGHRLAPGAPVLSRLGALVEGPGFLPHLTGVENLRLYWRATGRPEADARFDEALEIAGLGDASHRKVKTYSHGMKQRLAIAQAMLGLPELLVLDEPTDGLDPPQIAEMRRVLRALRHRRPGGAGLQPPAGRGGADLHPRRGDAQGRGGRRRAGRRHRRRLADRAASRCPTWTAAPAVLDELAGVRSVRAGRPTGLVVDLDGTPAPRWWPRWSGPASASTGWCPGAAWRTRSWPWSAATPKASGER